MQSIGPLSASLVEYIFKESNWFCVAHFINVLSLDCSVKVHISTHHANIYTELGCLSDIHQNCSSARLGSCWLKYHLATFVLIENDIACKAHQMNSDTH